jgi:hypothetical protein
MYLIETTCYYHSECKLGGDVNVTDNDGDTPIFTVENVETARWLVEHGASITHTNNEGVDVSLSWLKDTLIRH